MRKFAQDNWTEDPDSWAITIAHAIISSTFILYVLGLDVAAVKFRCSSPEYYCQSYDEHLFHYPGTVLLWDILAALITTALFTGLAVMCCYCDKYAFLLLKLAGVVPLLVLAAHAHYIIIAWITDPLYATGVGINYAIFYVIHLVVLKQSLKRTKQCYNSLPEYLKIRSIQIIIIGLSTAAVWLVSFSLQVLITVFFVYIPINHSIEDTPTKLLTIIQGIGAVFLGLIAWKVIVDPRGKGPLSTISGALRKAIKKKDPKRKLNNDPEWVGFDDEDKLAEVLHHVIKLTKPHRSQDPSGEVGTLSIISGALREAIQKKNPRCELHSDSEWNQLKDEQKLAEVLHHVIKIKDAPAEPPKPGNPSQSNHSQNGSHAGGPQSNGSQEDSHAEVPTQTPPQAQ